jgi:hypothetical protein
MMSLSPSTWPDMGAGWWKRLSIWICDVRRRLNKTL